MSRQEMHYPSSDGASTIRAGKWIPEGQPKAIFQIVHGMTEYIDRYAGFAEFLAENGYIVYAEDHLGHGKSVQSAEYYGYFGLKGNEWMITDIRQMTKIAMEENPGLPVILLGHSMGSFLVRQYITEDNGKWAEDLSGVIIMGTGWQPAIAMKFGKAIAKMLGTDTLGKTVPMLEAIAFGSYLKRIKNPRTNKDWLTRDAKLVEKYTVDPLCMFHFTANGFYHMFASMEKAMDTKLMKLIPAGLPLLLTSGAEDPVGNYGEGVRKAFVAYQENTDCDVNIEIYPDDRHEILNELNKDEVYADLLEFAEYCLSK